MISKLTGPSGKELVLTGEDMSHIIWGLDDRALTLRNCSDRHEEADEAETLRSKVIDTIEPTRNLRQELIDIAADWLDDADMIHGLVEQLADQIPELHNATDG